ncbi:MAG: hypothetical protein SF029_14885 [bacterium]|nr:hypothetical protein [bacterium]
MSKARGDVAAHEWLNWVTKHLGLFALALPGLPDEHLRALEVLLMGVERLEQLGYTVTLDIQQSPQNEDSPS